MLGQGLWRLFLCRTQHSVISSKLASSSTLKLSTNLHSLAVIPALEWLRMYFIGISCAWHKRWFQFASAGMSLKYNIWIEGVSRVHGGRAVAGFTGVMEQQGWVGLINVFRPHKTFSGALGCLTWRKFALAAGGTEFISLGSRIEGFFFFFFTFLIIFGELTHHSHLVCEICMEKSLFFFQAENQAEILEELVRSPQTQGTKLTELWLKPLANAVSFSK